MLLELVGYECLGAFASSSSRPFNMGLYLMAFGDKICTEVEMRALCKQLAFEDVAREVVKPDYRRMFSRALCDYVVTVSGMSPALVDRLESFVTNGKGEGDPEVAGSGYLPHAERSCGGDRVYAAP